jgi:hypothetical protein
MQLWDRCTPTHHHVLHAVNPILANIAAAAAALNFTAYINSGVPAYEQAWLSQRAQCDCTACPAC